MVRFRYKRPTDNGDLIYFPYYLEEWTMYDPNDTSKCTHGHHWGEVWQADEDRDRLHRKNSYYYPLESDGDPESLHDSPTLAILLFGIIIFCLFIPQVVNLFMTIFCPRPPRPPSPPTPPPGSECRKKFRLFHYAKPMNRPTARRSLVGRDIFFYDTENVNNYVSETRLKVLQAINDDTTSDEEEEVQQKDVP